MSVPHVGLVGYDYWEAERSQKSFDAMKFVRDDLKRPFFESYEFCGFWSSYSAGQSVEIGLNLPAYLGAELLYAAA